MDKLIFMADDDKLVLKVFEKNFGEKGFKVEVASDGEEAKKKIQEMSLPPTVFLLDVMMPKLNGFELLAFIKSQEKFKTVPVVFLTNLDSPEESKKAIQMGASLYLIKSGTLPREIIKKVEELIDKKP